MLTTMVAFASLLVSGIRPVIDFGMMMTLGLMVSFVLAFVMFPATVVLLKKDTSGAGEDFTHPFTLIFARITERPWQKDPGLKYCSGSDQYHGHYETQGGKQVH